jgi:hypothetical protein
MLKQMVRKIHQELENERKERVKNEEVLLGMLEQSC